MKLSRFLLAAALPVIAGLPVRADVLTDPQPPLVFAVRPDDTLGTAWLGAEGRSYFMEWSVDLVHWQYLPMMKHGAGTHTYDLPAQTEPAFFLRLHYTDQATTDPAGDDFDADGLSNWTEVTLSFTDPFRPDTDGDGIPDGWERARNLDPNNPADATADPDQDGLANFAEWFNGTDPANPDTDADGLTDGAEIDTWKTNPNLEDTDSDSIPDGQETATHHTDPTEWDTDGDLLSDGGEILETLTDPLTDDTDGDWIDDGFECSALLEYGTPLDPFDPADAMLDPDGDTLPTVLEYLFIPEGFNPFVADTPSAFPWTTDPDNDGETTATEWNAAARTNPKRFDTDADGMPDGWERLNSLSPVSAAGAHGAAGDPDGDSLSNYGEWLAETLPQNPDTDGDTRSDGLEVDEDTDPRLADSPPSGSPGDDDEPVFELEPIPFTVGDPSGSGSERWKMIITGHGPTDFRKLAVCAPGCGQSATRTIKLRKWNKYRVTLVHMETSAAYLRTAPGPDYDWMATADGLPSAAQPPYQQSPPYFMLRRHWLVDNSDHLLTPSAEGDGTAQDPTAGSSAMLRPVDIDDNQPASGTDDVSCTAPAAAGGYQPDHWIMAPAGPVPEDPGWGNMMVWKTPLPSAPELSITSLLANPVPYQIYLDGGSEETLWRGASSATAEDTPAWMIGASAIPVDLPIKVKVMKKRNLSLSVYPVRSLITDRDVPVPSSAVIAAEFNRVYGWQVNAWLSEEDVVVHPQSTERYGGESGDGRHIDANGDFLDNMIPSRRDPNADLNMIVLDRVDMTLDGDLCCGMHIGTNNSGTNNSFFVVTSYASGQEIPMTDVCQTATHEFGHAAGLGHPDEGKDPAPLPGTPRAERLMHSWAPGKRLVKAEWDEFEEWAKSRPNGDN